jgi:hypothetical protein
MNWDKVGGFLIENGLPLLGGVLGGPAGAAGGKLVASALGLSKDDPEEALAALTAHPESLVKLRELEMRHRAELEALYLEHETARVREINLTMREELKSEDWFVRRARPAFMWVTVFSLFVEVLIALFVALWQPAQISELAILFGALATPQSLAMVVCGVYTQKRTQDKALASGIKPGPGLLAQFFGRGAAG